MNNKISDLELIESAKKFDSDSLKELVVRYGTIYESIINRMKFEKDYVKIDMINDKYSFFYEMAKSYNPNKNTKFSTYIYNMTRWNCLDRLRKYKKQHIALELDIFVPEFDFSKTNHIIDKIKTFDDRVQYIFMHRFFNSNKKSSFGEIGKELNLTYEGVRQIYLKHLKILKKIT